MMTRSHFKTPPVIVVLINMFRLGMGAHVIRRKFVLRLRHAPIQSTNIVQADTRLREQGPFGAVRISWMRICRR
jgi:hypothetical protein